METDQISTADALLDVDKMNFGAWLRLAGDLSKEAWFFNSTLLQFGHNLLFLELMYLFVGLDLNNFLILDYDTASEMFRKDLRFLSGMHSSHNLLM